ncbi:MAG: hypothetical protein AAGD25_17945 [Cyanobacteria bacterium P01_F01_bin.150]
MKTTLMKAIENIRTTVKAINPIRIISMAIASPIKGHYSPMQNI